MFAFLLASLAGCATGPVFVDIKEVIVHTQTPGGTRDMPLEKDMLQEAINCLMTTQEIPQTDVKSDVIQEIVLVQVKDRLGDRMFEFTTTENFSARGKFYKNDCMYMLIKQQRH